jgi:hypothetical protein
MPELFDQYWKSLPTDLFTSQCKGSKAQARTEWDKLKPDKALFDIIMEHTKAKESVDRDQRRQNKFVTPWKHVCRLLKYKYYEDDLPKVKKNHACAPNKCRCGCGGKVDHAGYGLTWACYDKKLGDSMTHMEYRP